MAKISIEISFKREGRLGTRIIHIVTVNRDAAFTHYELRIDGLRKFGICLIVERAKRIRVSRKGMLA